MDVFRECSDLLVNPFRLVRHGDGSGTQHPGTADAMRTEIQLSDREGYSLDSLNRAVGHILDRFDAFVGISHRICGKPPAGLAGACGLDCRFERKQIPAPLPVCRIDDGVPDAAKNTGDDAGLLEN
jgi:hypothetical protein